MRSGLALTLLMFVVGSLFNLIVNLNADPATYPFGWELLPGSFKAGTVEEIGYRFFVVSLFVWIEKLFIHENDSRPKDRVYWMAILVASLLFGWAHNDARLGNPTPTFGDYALVMALNSTLGFFFGWIFRKLGLEWAMIAHFGFDAVVSLILIPVYLLESPAVWGIFIIGLIIALAVSWRMLLFKPGVRFDMPNTSST